MLLPQKEDLNTDPPNTKELYLQSFKINEATNQKNVVKKNILIMLIESLLLKKNLIGIYYTVLMYINHTLTLYEEKNILQVGLTYRFRNKDFTMVYYSRL